MHTRKPHARAPTDRSAETMPLDEIDVSRAERFQANVHSPFFARLRRENPVHFCAESPHGSYWSITRYDDILAVDKNHRQFSSRGNVLIGDASTSFASRAFIVTDPPEHTLERKAVMPAVSPERLAALEDLTRARIGARATGRSSP